MSCCSYCGKQGAGFKRCSICKEDVYCGAACQKAAWKKHKKKCAPPVHISDVFDYANDAAGSKDWEGVLKWEGRMEEMMERQDDDSAKIDTMFVFLSSHMRMAELSISKTRETFHARSVVSLQKKHAGLLGKVERFRDQGEAFCCIGEFLVNLGDDQHEAGGFFERARDVGAAHGFFSLESRHTSHPEP